MARSGRVDLMVAMNPETYAKDIKEVSPGGWLLYDSTIKEWDPWFAFVVAFVTFVAVVIELMPGLHAPKVSPGEYPYED